MDEEEEFMPPSPQQSRPSSPTYEEPSPETVRYNYEINQSAKKSKHNKNINRFLFRRV